MEVLFYVLCVTFFLSLFILKFKWFKKIGAWIAKPFVKLMKKRRLKKKSKQEAETQKSDRLGKSEFQIRPVVLPPQLNAPKREEAPKQSEKKEESLTDRKPMTMKEAFGDQDPFATRPIFPMAQQDYERRKLNQKSTPFGTRFAQNAPNNLPKGQDKIALDFLTPPQNAGRRPNFGGRAVTGSQMMDFANVQRAANSLKTSPNVFPSGGNMPRNVQGISTGTSPNRMANFDRANMNAAGKNFGGSMTQKTPEMDAIIAKRKQEFENYKRQKDSLKLDGQDVDMAGLPPKLRRILVMGVLDKKNYD